MTKIYPARVKYHKQQLVSVAHQKSPKSKSNLFTSHFKPI